MRGFEAWANRTSSQLVVIPGVLGLLGLYFSDVLGRPGLGTVLTLAFIGAALVGEGYLARRRARRNRELRLSQGEEFRSSRKAVVVGLSVQSNPWEDHPVRFLQDRTGAGAFGILVTEAAEPAWRELQSAVRDHAPDVHLVHEYVAEDQSTNVSVFRDAYLRLIRRVVGLVDGDATDVIVDLTGGSSVMSVGAYQAAAEAGADVTYIEAPRVRGGGIDLSRRRLRLVAEA